MLIDTLLFFLIAIPFIVGMLSLFNGDCKLAIFSLSFACLAFITSLLIKEEPKAVDVYKGNTSLEITYMDGVPVDSVVVLKRK